MPPKVTIRWDDAAQTVIVFAFDDGWTWDEFLLVLQDAYAMIDTVEHRVAFVSFATTPSMALTPTTIYRLAELVKGRHKRHAGTVIVSHSPVIKQAYHMLVRAFPGTRDTYHIADDIDAAREIAYDLLSPHPADGPQ